MSATAQPLVSPETTNERVNRLFWPESVVVVGASKKGGFVTEILKNLKKWGFRGDLAAVNPRYEEIEGVRCYPSLAAVPHKIGLAIVGIPSDAIPNILKDCEAAEVGAMQIISSGFSDQGAEGVAKQKRLTGWASRTGITVAGPHCLGLLTAANGRPG